MKNFVRLTFALLSALVISLPLPAAKPKKGPEILIVADTFGKEETTTRPSPENPISYMLFIGKQRDLGAAIAGIKAPSKEEIEALIQRTLSDQGYVRKEIGDTIPDIFIVYTFGSAYTEEDYLDSLEFDEETGEFSGGNIIGNDVGSRELFALVGGHKVLQQKHASRDDVESVQDAADTNRLFIMIAAVDGPKFFDGEKEIMWRTRISIPSRGFNLPSFMDLMLETAAPYFGKDSELPIFLREEDRRKTDVQIGDATVVEEPE